MHNLLVTVPISNRKGGASCRERDLQGKESNRQYDDSLRYDDNSLGKDAICLIIAYVLIRCF